MVREGGGGAAYANLRLWGSIGYILVATLTGLLLSGNANLSLSREGLDPVFRWGPLLFLAITALAWVLPDRKTDPTLATVGHSAGPNFRVFLVAYFLYLFALYGASSFLSLYLQSLGANSFWISLTFVGGVMVEVIVMRYAGYWSDHYGRRPLLLLSFFTLPLRLLLYIPAETPGAVAAVQLLHGINFGIMGAVAIVFANDLAGEGSHGLAQAKLAAATGLSGAFGPWILGAVAGRFGLPAMFLVAAVVALAAFAIMLLGVEDSRQESHALGERGPAWSRPIGRILDAPPRKKA
jgi:MFS family permease